MRNGCRVTRECTGDTRQGVLERSSEESSMKALIKRFVRDESGATAIEYGLIAAGIAVAIIAAVQATGTNLNGTFTAVSNAIK
jgi:pilus assembly protein Flp/PilA